MRTNHEGRPVLTPTEARQGRKTGVYRILFASLALAIVAALFVYAYFYSLW